jgi:hypothetical protein
MVPVNMLSEYQFSGQDSNVAPARHKSEALKLEQTCSVSPVTVNWNYIAHFEN